jgi:hypothetical protein
MRTMSESCQHGAGPIQCQWRDLEMKNYLNEQINLEKTMDITLFLSKSIHKNEVLNVFNKRNKK